jgi:hypothetical protein
MSEQKRNGHRDMGKHIRHTSFHRTRPNSNTRANDPRARPCIMCIFVGNVRSTHFIPLQLSSLAPIELRGTGHLGTPKYLTTCSRPSSRPRGPKLCWYVGRPTTVRLRLYHGPHFSTYCSDGAIRAACWVGFFGLLMRIADAGCFGASALDAAPLP